MGEIEFEGDDDVRTVEGKCIYRNDTESWCIENDSGNIILIPRERVIKVVQFSEEGSNISVE
jgi:hypothetical protein